MMATSGFQRSWVHIHSIIPRALRQRVTHNSDMAVEPEEGEKLALGRLQSTLPERTKTRRQEPLRRTLWSSRWQSWARPKPLAPRMMPLALMRDSSSRPQVSLSPSPLPTTSPTYLFLRRDCAQTCGRSGEEGRDASSALDSDEAGDDDMDKATRAAIARAYEVDRGDGGAKAARGKVPRLRAEARAEADG